MSFKTLAAKLEYLCTVFQESVSKQSYWYCILFWHLNIWMLSMVRGVDGSRMSLICVRYVMCLEKLGSLFLSLGICWLSFWDNHSPWKSPDILFPTYYNGDTFIWCDLVPSYPASQGPPKAQSFISPCVASAVYIVWLASYFHHRKPSLLCHLSIEPNVLWNKLDSCFITSRLF